MIKLKFYRHVEDKKMYLLLEDINVGGREFVFKTTRSVEEAIINYKENNELINFYMKGIGVCDKTLTSVYCTKYFEVDGYKGNLSKIINLYDFELVDVDIEVE